MNEETGYQFNLYELAGQILEFDHHDHKIVISICGSIQKEYDKNVPCSGPGYAACLVQGKNLVRVLGMQSQSPEVIANGALRFSYPSKQAMKFTKQKDKKCYFNWCQFFF